MTGSTDESSGRLASGAGRRRRWWARIAIGFTLLAAVSVFGLGWALRTSTPLLTLPKCLLVVCPDEVRGALEPLLARRRAAGFRIHLVSGSKALDATPATLGAPFQQGHALLVGNPFLAPSHPYFLPSSVSSCDRVYVRRPVGTGFPMGPVPIRRTSDRQFVEEHLGTFIPGRIPATSLAEVERTVARTLAYDDQFRTRHHRQFLLLGESGGFSPTIDGLGEGLVAGCILLNLPTSFGVTSLFDRHQRGGLEGATFESKVHEAFGEAPDVAAYFGHGSPERLGRLVSRDGLVASPLRGIAGPLVIMACQAGLQARGDLAETLILGKGGPSHVLFSAAITHPYSDGLLAFSLGGLLRETRSMTAGDMLQSAVTAARNEPSLQTLIDPLASALVDLTSQDRAGLRDDIGWLINLYGDPSQEIHWRNSNP